MSSEENNKTTTWIGIGIIILLLLSTGLFFIQNSKNKKSLEAEKLNSEQLLSEKLLVEKDLEKAKADISACEARVKELTAKLAETESALAARDRRIASLINNSAALAKTKKELEDLQKAKADLDNAYATLKSELEAANTQNNTLKTNINKLETEKSDLSKKLADALLYESDNFVVYGSRGKTTEKLTFRAGWTKKLNLNFDVPQNLTDAVSFKITTPSGKTVTPETADLSWKIRDNARNFTASLSPVTGEFEAARQVVMTYAPKEKFEKGEYKIEISTNSIVIGHCRVRFK